MLQDRFERGWQNAQATIRSIRLFQSYSTANILTAPSFVKTSRHVFVTVISKTSLDFTASVMAASELSSKLVSLLSPFAIES